MLSYDRLEQILNQLTPKEQFLKKHPDAQKDYSSLPQETVGGIRVCRFRQDLFEKDSGRLRKNFSIKLHERFSLVPMHVHNYIEMSYVYKGKFPQKIGENEVLLTEGQICLLDTNAPHEIRETHAGDIIVNMSISPEYFSEHFISRLSRGNILGDFYVNAINEQKAHDRYIIFPAENDRRFRLYFRELLSEYLSPSVCGEDIMEGLLSLILSELLVVYEKEIAGSEEKKDNRLIPVLKYLDAHYADCTLQDTAAFFGVHPNYLTAMLKKHTGRSFKELLLEKRLTVAAGLIAATADPITDIAASVGYQNMSYFYRKFQEKYDTTPAAYRNAAKL